MCVCWCWCCLCVVSSLNARESLPWLTCRVSTRRHIFSFRVTLTESIRRASIIILSQRIVQPFGRNASIETDDETHTLCEWILLSFCVMSFTGTLLTHTTELARGAWHAWHHQFIIGFTWAVYRCARPIHHSFYTRTHTRAHAKASRCDTSYQEVGPMASPWCDCARPLSHRRDRRADVCWAHSDGGWACAVCHCGFHCVPITCPHRVDRTACCAMNRFTLIGHRSVPTATAFRLCLCVQRGKSPSSV